MKAMEVMGYIEGLRLHSHTSSLLYLIVSAPYRILITLQEEELMVRTSTATSSSCPARPLNTSSRKEHFQRYPLLPVDTSHNIFQDIAITRKRTELLQHLHFPILDLDS